MLEHCEHPLSDVVGEGVEVLVERHALRGHGVEHRHADHASVQPAPDGVQNLRWKTKWNSVNIVVRGLPYMMSAVVGGGGPQNDDKRNKISFL